MYAAVLLIFTLFVCGCSQVVHVSHNALAPNANPSAITTKVLVQPPAKTSLPDEVEGGLFIVGMLNEWQLNFDQALPDALAQAAESAFEEVVIGTECDDCGLILRPRVSEINIDKLTMQSTMEISIQVLDANGQRVTTILAGGDSAIMDASRFSAGVAGYFIPLLGTALGPMLVRQTVQDAFEEAIDVAGERLAMEANSGVLARTWLPKSYHQNRLIGSHDVTAEKLAKSAGCNFKTDALELTRQQYGQETYTAHCWGMPQFTIACDLGRCEIASDSQLATFP